MQDENRPNVDGWKVSWNRGEGAWLLLLLVPLTDFVFVRPGFSCCKRRCPMRCPWPQTGPFDRTMCSLSIFPLGFQGLAPSDVDGTSSCDSSRCDQSGSRSPSFGCVAASRRVCAPPPVVAPRAHPCACPRSGSLMPTRRSCLAFRRRFGYILALQR